MVPLSAKQLSVIVGDSGCELIILRRVEVSSDLRPGMRFQFKRSPEQAKAWSTLDSEPDLSGAGDGIGLRCSLSWIGMHRVV
ncbi:MAG: hypothetical protein QOF72_289 [Blastocatellia bacterium]|nr:hypothetical protein [Blastocatellia bacterium]